VISSFLRTVFRFSAIGIANTAIGYAVIITALFVGATDIFANAFGYAVGLCISFLANRRWTFNVEGRVDSGEFVRFLALFAFCWTLNITVISIGISVGFAGNPLLHLAGIATYSISFLLLSNAIVYRPKYFVVNWQIWIPELSTITVACILFFMLQNISLTHDVVWQLWIARQMINGVSLYDQIFEINPPLWFWMALPVQWFADITGVATGKILVGCMTLLAVTSALIAGRISGSNNPVQRSVQMLLILIVVLTGCLYDFGQREQIVLATTIPYVLLIVYRAYHQDVSLNLAICVGFIAAFGFALKHYFVVIPIFLELFLLFNLQRKYSVLRPETLTILIMAVIYSISIFYFTPDFLNKVVPMVKLAYFGYEVPPYLWFDEPAQILWILSIVGILARGYQNYRKDLHLQAFLLAAVGFFIAYLAQRKGWQYHAIPTSGMLVMALASAAFGRSTNPLALIRTPFSMVLIACYLILAQLQGTYFSDREEKYTKLFRSTPEGSSIMVVASNPMWIWPTIENTRRIWPSRYFAHWMIPAIGYHRHVQNQGSAFDKMAQDILIETDHDIRCSPPALIIVEKGEPNYTVRPRNFDTLHYLQENSNISNYLAYNYVESESDKWLRIFRRTTLIEKSRPSNCRKIY
jgi:putative flippase GtrA